MKKTMTIFGAILFASFILTSCGTKKNDYPANVTQNFMNSCQTTSGGDQNLCSCLLEKIQEKYTFEEFTAIEVKMQTGKTPSEFLDFVGKAKAECNKK